MLFKDGLLGYNIWLQLPSEVRHKLVTLFDIPRSGRTTVEYRATGAVVTSDGFTPEDLGAISLTRMQGLLGSTSDNFYQLFEQVVTNIDALLGGALPVPKVEELMPTQKSAFCDQCDSKGVRHKKVCPKNEKPL